MYFLKLYWKLIKASLKSLTQYRADFIIGIISMLLIQVASLFFIFTIFEKVPMINGWSLYEVAYLYVMTSLTMNIYKMFFSSLLVFPEYFIKKGNLDIVLIKPVNELLFIIIDSFTQSEVASFIVNIILLVIVLIKLSIGNVVFSIFISIGVTFMGALIIAAVSMLVCCLSFKYTEIFMAIKLISGLTEFSKYPMDIYPKVIKGIFTFIIPFAFISYYPANALINGQYYYYLIVPIVTLVSVTISIIVWNHSLKQYSSTGT